MRLLQILRGLKSDDLFKAGSLMFFAALMVGAFNYFYHIFMGRTLGKATYGEFGALFALSFFLSFILIRTIRVSNAGLTSKLRGQNKSDLIPIYQKKMLFQMSVLGIFAFIIFSLLSGFIADFLHIDSIILVIIIGVVFIFSWLLPVNLGIMQGMQRFRQLALNNFIQASTKFFIGICLVLLGFGIYGAVGGLVFGVFIALISSFFVINTIYSSSRLKSNVKESNGEKNDFTSEKNQNNTKSENNDFNLKDVYKFSIFVLLAIACLTIPTNIDILFVKHFFSNEDTGLYTSASTFGRMIFYFPIGINTVMYPKVVNAYTRKKDTKNLLRRGLIYTGLPSGMVVIALWVFPEFFLGVFYGNEYLNAEPLLMLYAPLMYFFSITALLIYYNLAKNDYTVIYIFAFFSLLELVLIWFNHSTMEIILQLLLIVNIVVLCLCSAISYFKPEKYR